MNTKALTYLPGTRVNLRILHEDDVEDLMEIAHSPLARGNTLQRAPKTLEAQRAFIKDSNSGNRFPINMTFGIEHIESEKLIGVMSLVKIDWISRTASTASLIGKKENTGKGYGTEAKLLLLNYAFGTLCMRIIYSSTTGSNQLSSKSLTKCGYKEVARLKDKCFANGEYHDEVLYECAREDFNLASSKYKEMTEEK